MIHTLPAPTQEEYYKGYLIDIDTDPLLTTDEFIREVFGLRGYQYICSDKAKREYRDGHYILVQWRRDGKNCICVYGYSNEEDFDNTFHSQHEVTQPMRYKYTQLVNNDTTYGEL